MRVARRLLTAAVCVAAFAAAAAAQVKNVAVVETELDAQSGAASELNPAEVRQVTAELRREAVENLPRGQYNIMTSETVQAQGGAVLEECADENCVISLGSKIGADYIVRGIISKFRTKFTLTVEMYETENGNLVATSDPVRSEDVGNLLESAAAAVRSMYKKFVNEQNAAKKQSAAYTIAVNAAPEEGGAVSRNPDQTYYKPGAAVNVRAVPAEGYKFTGWSGGAADTASAVTVIVDGNMTLTANFQYSQKGHRLTTIVFPPTGGAVTRNPDKPVYAEGETVTLTAASAEGHKFTGWTGAATGRKTRATVKMTGNKTVTANFYQRGLQPPLEQAAKPGSSESQEPPRKIFAIGGGGLYSGGFGGGLRWYGNYGDEILKMPYDVGGGYLFFDASFASLSIGYSLGGGYWESPNEGVSPSYGMPYMSRSSINIGVSLKYPDLIKAGRRMRIYPILAGEFEYAVSGGLTDDSYSYVFGDYEYPTFANDKRGTEYIGYDVLSALWGKIGCGLDFYVAENTLLRLELLYGVRTSNDLESVLVSNDWAHDSEWGHGLTVRVGVGFKL